MLAITAEVASELLVPCEKRAIVDHLVWRLKARYFALIKANQCPCLSNNIIISIQL